MYFNPIYHHYHGDILSFSNRKTFFLFLKGYGDIDLVI